MTNLQPVEAAAIAQIDAEETAAEKFWKWIPLLGWTLASLLWKRRTWPIVEHIATQLTARPKPEPQIWGSNPQRVQLGLYLSRVAREGMGWPNDHFIPSDPVDVVFWAHEDGLDVEMAVITMEHELHIKIDDAEVRGWFGRTLGDVVDNLLAKQEQEAQSKAG